MTPYAVLLVKPTDADEVIRKAYHDVAKKIHPDKVGGAVGDGWHVYTMAYTAVKTAEKRDEWAKRQAALSGLCGGCEGSGVRGTRMFKGRVRRCEECGGEGRV